LSRPRRRSSDLERIELLLEHHVEDIRYSRSGKTIVALKHVQWGWISPARMYQLQELHTFLVGALPKFLEGGYRAKAALWGMSIDIGPVAIPIGLAFPVFEARALAEAIQAGNVQNIVFWTIALIAPFGDLLAILGFNAYITGGISDFFKPGATPFGQVGGGIASAFVDFGKAVFGPIFRLLGNPV
jgi:hypothetical protein